MTTTTIARGVLTVLGAMACALVPMATGCAAPLPRYPPRAGGESLRIIAERQARIVTVQAAAFVELSRPDGQSVTLDAAIAARPPTDLRLRAWKFDRAVFDATIGADGVWLVLPDDSDARERLGSDESIGAGLKTGVALLGSAFFESAAADEAASGADVLVAVGTVEGTPILCTIDRPTLVPRAFRSPDGGLALRMDRFEMISGVPWPMRMTIENAGGRVVITMRDVEINGELGPSAFTPPRRAVRQP